MKTKSSGRWSYVNEISHVFPYERSIMLNVLYDTLDVSGFSIVEGNSRKGVIIATSGQAENLRIRIECSSISMKEKTLMQVILESAKNTNERVVEIFMDKLITTTELILQ